MLICTLSFSICPEGSLLWPFQDDRQTRGCHVDFWPGLYSSSAGLPQSCQEAFMRTTKCISQSISVSL